MSDGPGRRPRREVVRLPGGLSLRALVPNAITAAALASGLTGIRFAITAATGAPAPTTPGLPLDDWQKAVLAVILAGMLDGIDGRIARLLKAQSRFGAELDSLSDVISFGVAPALIVFLWSLQEVPRQQWDIVTAHAQWRHAQVQHVESVVKVFTKLPFGHELRQITMRGRYDSHID